MSKVRLKLVALADLTLKAGQEVDADITVPEHGISASEIASNLVMMAHTVPEPNEPTGRAAYLDSRISPSQE